MTTSMIPNMHLPLAAGIDWLETLLPILFIGFWVLSQIVAIGRKIAGRPADAGRENRPAAPPPVPRRRQQKAADETRPRLPGGGGDLHEEIREFLGRASAPPAPRPVPREPRAAVAMSAGSRKPKEISSIAERVRADFAKELDHLSSPLTSRPLAGDESAAGSPPVVPAAVAAAQDIASMLRSPERLRHLVVLREILERPVDRW